ncbi:MAG: nitrite reductase small subunit NirD [Armatimonadota bacterium]
MNAAEERTEVLLGAVERVPAGEGRRFLVLGQEIAVFRGRDGSLYATQDRCPHRGAPLSEGILGGGEVICPYHAYRFDLAGGACANDAACAIRTYPVREEDGQLLVTV